MQAKCLSSLVTTQNQCHARVPYVEIIKDKMLGIMMVISNLTAKNFNSGNC